MKKIQALSVLLTGGMLLAACSTESPVEENNNGGGNEGNNNAEADGDEEYTIGFSVSTLNNPFFVSLEEAASDYADELGVELITADAQDDDATQINDVEDLMQQDIDLLMINPTDSDAVVSSIELANAEDIPVVTVDRGSEGGEVVTHVASDNVEGGEMAAELLVDLVGEGAEVAEIEGIPGSSAATERGEGFNNIADDQLDVVASQAGDFDRSEGLSVMEDILQGNEGIEGVFAHNDEMALGALEAAEGADREDLEIIGFDATDDAVDAVEEGRLSGTVAQQPGLIAEEALDAAVSYLNGEDVEDFVGVDLELVTE
ncbi:D-ribose ABC transporter substrate-binding protein [Salisediminibacterium halotolerans]|uniref:Ribose transport system substrate-binding protein n=1 Tax=Salisediminibacterium halotolerans TaxID=517425 RepID=A0A1H9UA34_9BACI|nr:MULTISPECIES: D-ribose ABC transporter substrate-binding protein [Salisediminibacterium]RLJ75641.1 ribose-binding protein [Actinophytocola xinjiangensis]RPE89495.1 ribose-binding protein [Salisediminibacterium halotolerans]TWG36254.1 ribose-binding protein [Salisediminibacterium halotolerans]SES06192.1 ribose transport system substrate-binding protein [Salisediminibacterium haloalkalitolerans]GEL09162.1 D-ribose ABC transporter substrate-binding protein [Salisediminibacterium halotolerans]